jgi:hypothetical protein
MWQRLWAYCGSLLACENEVSMYIYTVLIWGENILSEFGLQKLLELCNCCTYLNVSFHGGEMCVIGGLKGCVLCVCLHLWGWDLAERSERCAGIPKVAGSNLSGGNESTLRSDLLLTARGSSTWVLIVVACLLCYPGNTLCSERLELPGRAG